MPELQLQPDPSLFHLYFLHRRRSREAKSAAAHGAGVDQTFLQLHPSKALPLCRDLSVFPKSKSNSQRPWQGRSSSEDLKANEYNRAMHAAIALGLPSSGGTEPDSAEREEQRERAPGPA